MAEQSKSSDSQRAGRRDPQDAESLAAAAPTDQQPAAGELSCQSLPSADPPAAPGQNQSAEMLERIKVLAPRIERLYRGLHAQPELSLQEERTAARLAEEFRQCGLEVTTGVGGHGVVAVLKNGPGPTVLVRGDMDALPIKELTEVPYRSVATVSNSAGVEVPVMHACGHDMHTSVLAGTAALLCELQESWSGTLVCVGQPAEELGLGARMMIEDGLFERFPVPDYCLALHVDPQLEAGTVGYVSGPMLSYADDLDVTFRGKGGHASAPDQAVDPVTLSARFIMAIQTLDTREVSPLERCVITVGSIHGGSKRNVIPDEVRMELTVRAFSKQVMEQLLKAIEREARGIAIAGGVPDDQMPLIVDAKKGYTAGVINDPELTARVRGSIARALGADRVFEKLPLMGSEDFGTYCDHPLGIPCCMFTLGAVESERFNTKPPSELPGLHTGNFLPDYQKTLATGIHSLSTAVLDLLQSGQE